MLPLLIDEAKIFPFKFWLNDNIQDGMCYRNELFCRLRSFDVQLRPQVYHLGCRLAQGHKLIVLTSSKESCSLWGSLRDPNIQDMLLKVADIQLPTLNFSQAEEKFGNESDPHLGKEG